MVQFGAEVLAVTPATNQRGERLIKIDFGIEERIVITEKHAGTATLTVGLAQAQPFKNPLQVRFNLFLTHAEWSGIKRKYTVGDRFMCNISENGEITIRAHEEEKKKK